jgi:RNA polymerase sigma-70 factor (ECF subfamily)
VSFEALTDADRDRLEPVDKMDPEKLYVRRWVLTLLDTARQRLREDFRNRGNSERYDRLEVYLSGDKNGPPYAEVAAQLGLSVSGVKTAVERMRERFSQFVRAEVAKTVSSDAEVEEELKSLLSVISPCDL